MAVLLLLFAPKNTRFIAHFCIDGKIFFYPLIGLRYFCYYKAESTRIPNPPILAKGARYSWLFFFRQPLPYVAYFALRKGSKTPLLR